MHLILDFSEILQVLILKLKVVDSNYFHFDLFFFYSIFRTRVRVRVTRSHCHTSVTSDDMVTSHERHRKI